MNELPLAADDMSIGFGPHRLHVVFGEHPLSNEQFKRLMDTLRDGLSAFESVDLFVISPHTSRHQFSALVPLEQLEGVVLQGQSVDDAWIQELVVRGPRVQSLQVIGTKITSAGLLPLASLRDLRFLLVSGSTFDVETRQALRRSNPSLRIETRD